MENKTELRKITTLERQILMYEMFFTCRYIDKCVINQYFPFVDSTDRKLALPPAAKRMVLRDLKDLCEAGVASYKYNKREAWYESLPADFELKIPADTEARRKQHIEKLNFFCRYIYEVSGLEDDLTTKEMEREVEFDESVLDFKYDTAEEFRNAVQPRSDYDVYRYDDPYVVEYIKLRGNTTIAKIKADFGVLEKLGYLSYNFDEHRFQANEDLTIGARQTFDLVKGADGKFYI